ncbi:MAG: AMP-binding protein [bacterium]|nr:AMP-binding protein [bacterium]
MDDPIALDMLAAATQKWPGRVAVRSAHHRLTFAELNYAATEIAGRVPNGARIAFRAEMNIATIAALWGIPRGGGVAVPIDPQLDVAAADDLAASLDATLGWPERRGPDAVELEPLSGRPVVVVTTSGSGGVPRGVLLTAGNIRAAADASQIHLNSRSEDSWLLVMPLHHVAGLAILWRAAHDGSQIVLHDGFDPAAVATELSVGVTWVSLVPTMLTRLLREANGPWPGVRGALVGGAHASYELVAEANAAGLETLPTYGMTETAAQVCTVRPGNVEAAAGTVGHSLPGVEVTIDAPPGQPGAIGISGPTVSPGYVGEPARSGTFATNDIGYFDQSGRLVVIGRSDDVVVTGGEKVHPGLVERALLQLPAVTGAVAFGLADAEWGERLVAVVTGDHLVSEDLRDALASELSRHAVPKEFRIVDRLPLLSNGKIDRATVRRQAGA